MALINSKIKLGTSDIKIKITYSGTNPVLAGYLYQLKNPDINTPIEERHGDNQNSQDDIYSLPTPIQNNVGRKVIVTSNIAAMDKNSDYTVKIDVIQNGDISDTLISNGHVDANDEAALSFDIIKFIKE